MNNLPQTLRVPLERALSVKRGSGSTEEAQFRAWLAKTYAPNLDMIDEAGNLHFKVGKSRTLFAAHTDTVHHKTGLNRYTVKDGRIRAGEECLGADDGAGVALLCHMMSNSIPGYYLFTTQEECGGLGAKYVAETALLRQFDRSICFDRRGTGEIITVQGGYRCASSEFADALSIELSNHDLMYMESENGTYTDNKEFAPAIPECVNLAIGYDSEHGPSETLDLNHLETLARAAISIDWDSLPTTRLAEPKPKPTYDYGNYSWMTGTASKTNLYDDLYDSYDDSSEELSEALVQWYKGKPHQLQEMVANHMATLYDLTVEESMSFVVGVSFTEDQIDDLPLAYPDTCLDLLVEFCETKHI